MLCGLRRCATVAGLVIKLRRIVVLRLDSDMERRMKDVAIRRWLHQARRQETNWQRQFGAKSARRRLNTTMCYTFIAESNGSTLVEQFSGRDVRDALQTWTSGSKLGVCWDRETPLDEEQPTPVAGVRHVWCYSGVGRNDRFYLVHIVATSC